MVRGFQPYSKCRPDGFLKYNEKARSLTWRPKPHNQTEKPN